MNHNVISLSPRRVKPAPTIVLYELRLLRVSARPASMLPLFEARTKKWRGVLRWALHAFSSSRAELVLQVIVERQAVARVDNLFATWRRTLTKVMGKAFDLRKLRRAEWLHVGASDTSGSVMADVRVLFDAFDSGCAKLWADSHDPAAVRCSYLEPALPAAAMVEKAAPLAARPLLAPQAEAVGSSIGPLSSESGTSAHTRTKDVAKLGIQLGILSTGTLSPPPPHTYNRKASHSLSTTTQACESEPDRPPAIRVSLSS